MREKKIEEIIPTIRELKDLAEQKYIIKILNTVNWRISDAAQLMGINRSTLFRKMKKYGITKRRQNKLIL